MNSLAGLFCMVVLAVGPATAGTPTVPSFPFFDDVEDEASSTAYWGAADGGWVRATADGPSGAWAWQIVPDQTQRYLTLAFPLDLSLASNPYLSLWIRNLGGRLGYRFEASSDGGATWIVLASVSHNNGQWVNLQYSMTAFRSDEVLLRFSATPGVLGALLQVDDILLDNAPLPLSLTLAAPNNHGFTVGWTRSIVTDFGYYLLVLDTRSFGISNPTNPSVLSGRHERRVITIKDQSLNEWVFDDLAFSGSVYLVNLFEVDAQGLMNEGTDFVQLQTTLEPGMEVAPFVQDFERQVDWLGEPPWGVGVENDGNRVWQDSPDRDQPNYDPSADRRSVVQIDFTQVLRPLLRFDHRYDFEPRRDYGRLAYSLDGNQWVEIVEFTGFGQEWRREEVDLSFLGRRQALLRFGVFANSTNEYNGWTIDNVAVVENTYQTEYGFFDGAESEASLDKWIGSGAWARSPVDAHSGDFSWSIQPLGEVSNHLTLAGTMDLTQVANPDLSFWVRTEGGRVDVQVEASGDGGGSWTNLATSRFYNNEEWQQERFSLAPFFGGKALVRFGADQLDPLAKFFLDDVRIDFPPTILGDASGDGNIGPMDAALVLQHAVGLVRLVGGLFDAADVSGNGRVSAYDATLILQYLAELISAFPAEGVGKLAAAGGELLWGDLVSGPQGTRISAPLVLEGVRGQVRSVQLSLPLDFSAVEVLAVESNLPADWQLVHHKSTDGLELALAGITPVDSGVLAQLFFEVGAAAPQLVLAGSGVVNEGADQLLAPRPLSIAPLVFGLEQNWPNPFNSTTVIRFALDQAGPVELSVYNLTGQKVATLVEGQLSTGYHQVQWDGRDQLGRNLASGIYLYRLEAGSQVELRRLMLLK